MARTQEGGRRQEEVARGLELQDLWDRVQRDNRALGKTYKFNTLRKSNLMDKLVSYCSALCVLMGGNTILF